MAESVAIPASAGRHPQPVLLAVFLSALIPGAGQLLLGQRRKGLVFLLCLVALLLLFWPARLPRSYPAAIGMVLGFIAISFMSAFEALAHNSAHKSNVSRWYLLAVVPVTLLAGSYESECALKAAGFRIVTIVARAMEPTVLKGDTILIDEWYYRRISPLPGDIVVFTKNGLKYVLRVAAVEGQSIRGRDGKIWIDEKQLEELYIQHIFDTYKDPQLNHIQPAIIPKGKLFVMGDNRDLSLDSRSINIGLVDVTSITGKPLYVLRGSNDPESESNSSSRPSRYGKSIR